MKLISLILFSMSAISCIKFRNLGSSETSGLPIKQTTLASGRPQAKSAEELIQFTSSLARSLGHSTSSHGHTIPKAMLHSTLAKAIIKVGGLPREQIVQVLLDLIREKYACGGISCHILFADLMGEKGEHIEKFLDELYVEATKSEPIGHVGDAENRTKLVESLRYSQLYVGPLNGTLTLPRGYRFVHAPVMSTPDAQGSKGAIFYVKSDGGEDWVLKVLKCAAAGTCDDEAIAHLQKEAILSVESIGVHGLDMATEGLPPYSMLKRKVNGVSFESLIADDKYKHNYIYNASVDGKILEIPQKEFEDGLIKLIDDLTNDGRTIADLNPGNIFYDYDKRTWVVIDGDVIKEKRPQALAYVENVASLTGMWGLCDIKQGSFFEKCFFGDPRKGFPIRSAETKKAMTQTFHKLACNPKQYFKYVHPTQVKTPKIVATATGFCGY